MSRALHRFYFAGKINAQEGAHTPGTNAPAENLIELSAEESHHLLKVLRLRAGATVEVFDGDGAGWRGEVSDQSGRGAARVRLLEAVANARGGEGVRREMNLAVCLIKHRGMDLLIEKLSELGVDTLQPLVSARTVVQAEKGEKGEDGEKGIRPRWERIALAAAKQSGRNRPLRILPPLKLAEWMDSMRAEKEGACRAFAHFGDEAKTIGEWLQQAEARGEIWVAIGPEGGWTEEEAEAFVQNGFSPLTLGRLTLRAETAALVAAAAGLVV